MPYPLKAIPKPERAERKAKKPLRRPQANGCGHSSPDESCGYCRRKLRTRATRICKHCGKEFWPYRHNKGWSKYCTAKCYRAHRPAFIDATCVHCGKSFRRTRAAVHRRQKTFCSRDCTKAFTRGENSALYRGKRDTHRGSEWNRIAERIRARDAHRCRWCGKTQDKNKQRLSVDHIVPWRAFENKLEANAESNLVSLCRSCHQKKTIGAERRWLRGDVLGLQAYRRNVGADVPAAD